MTVIKIEGLRELERALKEAEPLVYRELRRALDEAAEPVARQAHSLALQNIPKVTEPWSEFRVGSTTQVVYVAPKQRGSKVGPRKRPKFATLLTRRALEPAVPFAEATLRVEAEQALNRAIREAGLG